MMNIYVKLHVDGATHSLAVDIYDDMEEVKRRIELVVGVPAASQRLIFAGKQLEAGRNLQDYCIQKDSTLHLLRRNNDNIAQNTRSARRAFSGDGELAQNVKPLQDLTQWPVDKCLVADWAKHVTNVLPDSSLVVRFPLFTPQFAKALFDEIDHFCEQTKDSGVALRMQHLKLDTFLDSLLRPVITELMPKVRDVGAAPTTGFHILPKAMRYFAAPGMNQDWPAHCDGDLMTLNVRINNLSLKQM